MSSPDNTALLLVVTVFDGEEDSFWTRFTFKEMTASGCVREALF